MNTSDCINLQNRLEMIKYEINKNLATDFKNFLLNIKEFFDNSSESIHKARNEIKIIDFENESLTIKSFKIPHIINQIVYSFFKSSKAKKSYDNSVKIINFVPQPIGYIEFKKFGLLTNSYFVSENFKYDFTIREPLIQSSFDNRDEVFRQFAKFTFELHEQNIFHLDYSPGNILIKKEDNNYIFKIVDINRMQFKELPLDERMKNFSKLWAKNEYLELIIKEYSLLCNKEYSECIDIALKYSMSHKDRINAKKRRRGQSVVD